jgi:hypothetical protein
VAVDDDRPDFGLIGDPPELIGGDVGAVGGVGEPGFGEQFLKVDGDHDGGWYPADRGKIGAFQ